MWMPVIFVCLVNGQCGFWTTDLLQTERECNLVVVDAMSKMERDDAVEQFEGVCLPVKLKSA